MGKELPEKIEKKAGNPGCKKGKGKKRRLSGKVGGK